MHGIKYVISLIVTILSIYFSIINFSKNKITLKSFIIYFIIILPSLILISLNTDGIIRITLNVCLVTISLYFSLFYKKVLDAIYYAIIYELFAFILEIILSVVFVTITNLNLKENYSILMLIFSILNSLGIYLVSCIKLLSGKIKKLNKILTKSKSEFIYIIVILVLMMSMMVYNYEKYRKDSFFYVNASLIAFVSITLIYIIYRDFQNEYLTNKNNEMMQYLCKYEKIINDQGKKNHEYNNQLMVIKGYMNNPKKLEEYLSLIIEEHKCGQNYAIRQLSYFPNGGIKGLIYDKLSKMEENNIKSYLYIDKNAKDIFEDKFDIKTYQDITKLLGVFLDNAIEASLESKEKEIDLEITTDSDCSIITISNTYNENLDIKQIGKKGFSTKGIGHGYGLSIVKDISKHNKNIETFNDIEDNKFKQTVIIYYSK
ncbi:MAG: GHKL domain-containing protein [Bacilli bacterium]|nr:GHKL domain-containing protein [Bacilli bacterium]